MDCIKISEIPRSRLIGFPETVSITGVKRLSSYNWIEAAASTPTIARDSGLVYIAQNAARHPQSPLEPLFRALYVADPSFDLASVALVSDRNNIRKLLSFVNPTLAKGGLEYFTIEVEIAGDSYFGEISPHEFKGYGHEFEEAYTTEQVDDSTGHHWIISYQLGGLKPVVRYETDGFIVMPPKVSPASTRPPTSTQEHGDISRLLDSLSLSSAKKQSFAASDKSILRIMEEGQVIPIESTLEIKTRTFKKMITVDEVLPQMWTSQTPNLVHAYHRNGVFERPEVENVTEEMKSWEKDHQMDLAKLATLLKDIISAVKASDGSAIIKYDDLQDKLVIWKAKGEKKMLPEDIYSNFGMKGADKTA
ncbi:hypothetical protein BJX70DRAFT_387886 [Aspergillus crustosus]